jgi:hypothetical protein
VTRDRIRAQQAAAPPPAARLLRVTVVSISPLVIQLPGGAQTRGIAMAGATYVPGAAATVLFQEPALGPVIPSA